MRCLFALISGCALLAASCSRPDKIVLDPPPPVPTLGEEAALSASSTVVISVSTSLAALAERLNRDAPDRLASRQNWDFTNLLKEDWVAWDITRDAIDASGEGDRLVARTAFRGTVSAGGQFNPVPRFGRGIGVQESMDLQGSLVVSTGLRVRPDWTVASEPVVSVSLSRASMKIAGVEVSMRGKIEPLLSGEATAIAQREAPRLIEQLDLRSPAEALWQAAAGVHRVDPAQGVWLRTDPTAVSIGPLVFEDGTATTSIRVTGRTRVMIADEQPSRVEPSALPALEPFTPGNGFDLQTPVQVSMGPVSHALQGRLAGQTITLSDTASLVVKAVEIGTSGDRLVLKLSGVARDHVAARPLRADVVLYLLALPVLDPAKSEVVLRDVQFDVQTRSALLQAAAWIAERPLTAMVEERARIGFGDELSAAGDRAASFAEQAVSSDSLRLSLLPKEIRATGLRVYAGQVFAVFSIQGEATLEVAP